jgi:hypothetical protein
MVGEEMAGGVTVTLTWSLLTFTRSSETCTASDPDVVDLLALEQAVSTVKLATKTNKRRFMM